MLRNRTEKVHLIWLKDGEELALENDTEARL